MLSERFLVRLEAAFPGFHDRVNADALVDAARLRADAKGDLQKALVRARFEGASRLWWPYLRGTVPVVGDDLPAMEAFSRLVLTVDHLAGHSPKDAESARRHVVQVLRSSLDVERLGRLLGQEGPGPAKGAVASVGFVASMGAVVAPLRAFGAARKWVRFMPPPLRVTLAAVIVSALLSVPFLAGYSAGHQAEKAARGATATGPPIVKGQDPRIRV